MARIKKRCFYKALLSTQFMIEQIQKYKDNIVSKQNQILGNPNNVFPRNEVIKAFS